ncbi:sterol carrier family protein [Corynebacterium caspium]|uniref:sterol carrier family protein n=1 Tax=Corynebacterium caspium TaxID=234828 RepID=UPI00036B984D|nr:sterol carrier family protein [Corynebacterium caspium]
MAPKNDPQATRAAMEKIAAWLTNPSDTPLPARSVVAEAVRRTARAVAAEAPGHSVELRIPPFVAVQCIAGPRHTRGTPPNVVETNPETWLQLASGKITFAAAVAAGQVSASGTQAGEVANYLPITPL